VGRRNLVDPANEARRRGLQLAGCRWSDAGRARDAPGRVVGRARRPEDDLGPVPLAAMLNVISQPGGRPHAEDQHAGGKGIQRAGMADLGPAPAGARQQAADQRHHVVAGRAGRFSHVQQAEHLYRIAYPAPTRRVVCSADPPRITARGRPTGEVVHDLCRRWPIEIQQRVSSCRPAHIGAAP